MRETNMDNDNIYNQVGEISEGEIELIMKENYLLKKKSGFLLKENELLKDEIEILNKELAELKDKLKSAFKEIELFTVKIKEFRLTTGFNISEEMKRSVFNVVSKDVRQRILQLKEQTKIPAASVKNITNLMLNLYEKKEIDIKTFRGNAGITTNCTSSRILRPLKKLGWVVTRKKSKKQFVIKITEEGFGYMEQFF